MSTDSQPGRPFDSRPLILLTWIWVGVPFGYGIYQLMHKIHALFAN
jgi:hypothetical protein